MAGLDTIADIALVEDNDMVKVPQSQLGRLLRRWSNQQTSALRQMSQRKTFRQRLDAFNKSERVDAKILLLGMVPLMPVILSDEIGWERGTLWSFCFWASLAWLLAIAGFGLAPYLKELIRLVWRK